MNDVIQAKPDELEEISKQFERQEEEIGEMRGDLVRMNDRLKQGWIGLGSEAYFKEAEEKVLPAVLRLQEALGEASRLIGKIEEGFGEADQEAAGPFKESDSAGAAAAQQAAASQGGGAGQGAGGGGGTQGAGAGQGIGAGQRVGAGGLRSDGLAGEHLASRLNNAGFGNLSSSPSRGSSLARLGAGDMLEPRDYSSSLGSGSGLGSRSGGGGGGGGGGGSLGSILGALRGQADAGFGLSGMATGGTPELSYSGLGGFGGPGGGRPLDFGLPLAIAAASPLVAVLGKVVKNRTENN
jgi:WXG100 family type VII secretion target